MRILVFVTLVLISYTAAQKQCGACEKCASPIKDLKQLFYCRVSTLFPMIGVEKLLKTMATQVCEGESVEEIMSKFLPTAQKAADLSTLTKLMSVIGPYDRCLRGYNSKLDTALSQLGEGIASGLKQLFNQLQKKVKEFKGKCTSDEMYNALAKIACTKLTHGLVQQVINEVIKTQKASWQCAPDTLDGKLFLLSYYKGTEKSKGK